MKYRSTIVYLLAALILGGIYFYDLRVEEKKEEAEEKGKLLFQVEADQIERMSLTGKNGTIRLEKSGEAELREWNILAPLRTVAESYRVIRIADLIAGLKHVRLISENADDLEQFGLDKPVFSISFSYGKVKRSLFFGHRSPIADGFYAKKDKSNQVYLITTSDKEGLGKTLFDLRDKKLFRLDTGRINRIVIDRKIGKWVLFKKNETWLFQGNEALKIDQEKMASLIRRLIWAETISFEREDKRELILFGLDTPVANISLHDPERSEKIFFGNQLEGRKKDKIYAMMNTRPHVVTVESSLLNDLPLEVIEFVKKEKNEKEKVEVKKNEPF